MKRKRAASRQLLRRRVSGSAKAFCTRTDRYQAGPFVVPVPHNDATVTDITHLLPLIFI